MSRFAIALVVIASMFASAQDPWPGRGDPGRGASLERFLNQEILSFHNKTKFPPLAKRAIVMNDVWMSTESYDFNMEEPVCPPDKNFERRLKWWNNGSCTDRNTGLVNKYIERMNTNGEVIYFRCNQLGVHLRSLLSEALFMPVGDLDTQEIFETRVLVKGREVGTYEGMPPNRLIAYDIRNAPTNNDLTLYQRIVEANGGYMKLEVSDHTYYKFELQGIKRALEWCTDLPEFNE